MKKTSAAQGNEAMKIKKIGIVRVSSSLIVSRRLSFSPLHCSHFPLVVSFKIRYSHHNGELLAWGFVVASF